MILFRAGRKDWLFCLLWCRVGMRQANVPMRVVTTLSRGIVHNVGACAVAGIGGLGNVAKRNAKTDQLRPVPRHNLNKETESNEDTEPGHCTSILLPAGHFVHDDGMVSPYLHLVSPNCLHTRIYAVLLSV